MTAGKTIEEARHLAEAALALHIQGMTEDGEAVPSPSALDALANDPAMKRSVVILVALDPAAALPES